MADCTTPTAVEIEAAERVIADWAGQSPDGYWRTLAIEVLEAASEAQLKEFILVTDREIAVDHYAGVLAEASMNRAGTFDLERDGLGDSRR
jgi:hypothetical protein